MKNIKSVVLAGMMVVGMGANAADFLPSSHNWNSGSVDMVKKTIAEAYKLNAEAKGIGFEWRDTVLFIEKAEHFQGQGKAGAALKAAKFAKHQAWLSLQQGIDQIKVAGPHNHF